MPTKKPAASDPLSIAVSALGRKGTYPADAVEVGVISTFPGGYAVMDGTSMATPAATGAAARLLGTRRDLLGMPRDASRSDAIAQLLLQSARTLALGVTSAPRSGTCPGGP